MEELTDYLHNVFRVVYETEPHAAKASGVSPLELAAATARTVFDEEAGSEAHSYLTLPQFKAWFTQSGSSAVASTVREAPESMSLAMVRKLTHLDAYSSAEVFRVFMEGADDFGRLDRAAFNDAFETIFSWSGKSSIDERTQKMLNMLFESFDENSNGFVDHQELLSMMSSPVQGYSEE